MVGRGVEVQARVDLPGVSRRHARIVVERGTAILEDLNSKNGTFCHGERVTSVQPLTSGDEVAFGAVRAVFFIASPDPFDGDGALGDLTPDLQQSSDLRAPRRIENSDHFVNPLTTALPARSATLFSSSRIVKVGS